MCPERAPRCAPSISWAEMGAGHQLRELPGSLGLDVRCHGACRQGKRRGAWRLLEEWKAWLKP